MYDLTMSGIVSVDGQHPLLSNWVVYTLNHLLKDTPPPPVPIPQPPTQRRTPRFPSTNMQSIGGPQDFKPLPAELRGGDHSPGPAVSPQTAAGPWFLPPR